MSPNHKITKLAYYLYRRKWNPSHASFFTFKLSFKLLFVGVKCQNVLLPKNNFLNFDSFFAEKLLLRRCWWFFFCLQMSFKARQVLHHSPKTSIAWDRWDNCATEIELQTSPISYACFIDEWLHVHLRGSGGGSVGREVASDTRDLQFESQHYQNFIYQLYS